MGYPTPIEWTDATWNIVGGCSIKSPGCINCYAQRLAGTRLAQHPLYAGTTSPSKAGPVFNGHLTAAPDDADVWIWPLRWRGAKEPKLGPGKPSLIFVGDMSDLFHEDRPVEVIDQVISTTGAADDQGRDHIFQILTKRADRLRDYMRSGRAYKAWNSRRLAQEAWPPHNIWFGFSAERQQEFDERWPHMREIADMGPIFVSYEPALGPLTLPPDFLALGRRAQVIFGGESGARDARPPHPAWPRAVRDQCVPAGVAFFYKQHGEWTPDVTPHIPVPLDRLRHVRDDGRVATAAEADDIEHREGHQNWKQIARVGKAKAGRLLDGRSWDQFPT